MSETEAPKKKKPILPIAMVLILLLLGGGFFMLKGKDKSKVKPEIVLAEKDTDVDEFLTNTANPTVYVRVKMTVRLRKDYEETKFKENLGDIRDAVILILNGLTPAEITDPKKRPFLKRTIAEAINTALEGPLSEADAAAKPNTKKRRAGKVEKIEPAAEADAAPKTSDWDSDTGPVLKVRFSSLATQ